MRCIVSLCTNSIALCRRYDENDPASLGRVHQRVAERFYNVCTKNLGLYVKLGQGYERYCGVLFVEANSRNVLADAALPQ